MSEASRRARLAADAGSTGRRGGARRHAVAVGLLLVLVSALAPGSARAQRRPDLRVRTPGAERSLLVAMDRGYAAVRASDLSSVGWSVASSGGAATFTGPGGVVVTVSDGTPYFRWDGTVLQLTEAPYVQDAALWVPLQLLTDFLPAHLPDRYAFDGGAMLLTVKGEGAAPEARPDTGSSSVAAAPSPARATPPASPTPETPQTTARIRPDDGTRVVIIDAGHGGEDPGSISKSGIREKTVALGVALAMAQALKGTPGLEVHLTRDSDTFPPLWSRGAEATKWKGDHPGVFVSIHANSFNSSSPRGFETYFLSEARTEHERRVAAIENAPMGVNESGPSGSDLDFILKELTNLNTQHWSALLAEMVQDEMAGVHPGPNRGVKQAPLAVLTNALMPSVLVELGYLSQPDEAKLLGRKDFQQKAGKALAEAVLRFFQRYPPGSGSGAGEGR